jgi:putative SOS response-associated peptidase YedK
MCGRYSLHANPEVIALAFKLGLMPEIKARYNIAPSTQILIVREDKERGRTADLYRWGLIPGWAKDPAIGNKLANARGETVAEKQLLKPYPAAAMGAHRVSRRVNTAQYDDPALIEPFESATT